MKFRTRIILVYAVLALVTSLGLGLVYNRYLTQRYETSAMNRGELLTKQMLNNLDGTIEKMSQVALALLSDQEAVRMIRRLSVDMEFPDTVDTVNARAYIRKDLYTAYNLDNFYRVIVFNRFGYIAASAVMQDRIVNTEKEVSEITWLEKAEGTKGKPVLLGLHSDDWSEESEGRAVFSVVKEIQGDHLGFIEVQQTKEELEEIFAVPDETMRVIALTKEGETLYASEGIDADRYRALYDESQKSSKRMLEKKNASTGEKELIFTDESEKSGVKLMLIQEKSAAVMDVPNGWSSSAGVSVLVFVPSLAFVIFMAERLTRPLQKLRARMESTGLSNLTDEIGWNDREEKDEDIQALAAAYRKLMFRLNESMEVEKRLSLLQLQAQFDTLQAQINPHFLYNVLNVISSRGMEGGDETICEICGRLASMLRYSTNTKTRYSTVAEELEYAGQYFYLIKSRYEEKIELDVQVEEGVKSQIIPKIVIQQIVENCVNHGFQNNTGQMRIRLLGYERGGYWYLSVQDNGAGFSENSIRKLQERMEELRENILGSRNQIELEIGGMGLANTYARLLLLYSDSLVFEVRNIEDGAEVLFGAKTVCDGKENACTE